MKKYKKVNALEVLTTYEDLTYKLWEFPHIPMEIMKETLKTSEYRIRKAYKLLEELGYMEKVKIPTVTEEYDDGFLIHSVPILECRAYTTTSKGVELARKIKELNKT